MGKRNKLQKFAELLTYPNVYESFDPTKPDLTWINGQSTERKGQWGALHFGNDHPIILELACGRGEYTLGMARMFPQRSFIGVDVKGARIWRGATTALEEQLSNAAFLRTRIEVLPYFFAPKEVSEIWITFPDPFIGKPNRRLTAFRFLEMYRQLLPTRQPVHLKTDDTELFEFTLEQLEGHPQVVIDYQDWDIYAKPLPLPELGIPTYYERLHQGKGKTIKYVRFFFN